MICWQKSLNNGISVKDAVNQKLNEKEKIDVEAEANLTTPEIEEAKAQSETEDKEIQYSSQTILCLKHLWESWQQSSKKPFRNIFDTAIKEAVGEKVMLTEKIENFSAFKVHPNHLETITQTQFSWEMWESQMVWISQPFQIQNLYANQHFADAFYVDGKFEAEPTIGAERYNEALIFATYGIILRELYNLESAHVLPTGVFTLQKKNGDHFDYFKLIYN